jgi:hypothetical protein
MDMKPIIHLGTSADCIAIGLPHKYSFLNHKTVNMNLNSDQAKLSKLSIAEQAK